MPCLLALFFLDVLHTHWCMLIHAEIWRVKFRKDRVKFQIWGKPAIFSHELCLYITRFHRVKSPGLPQPGDG